MFLILIYIYILILKIPSASRNQEFVGCVFSKARFLLNFPGNTRFLAKIRPVSFQAKTVEINHIPNPYLTPTKLRIQKKSGSSFRTSFFFLLFTVVLGAPGPSGW